MRSFHPDSLAAKRLSEEQPDTAVLVFDHDQEPSLTVQSDADRCDINKIMKRFEKTGVLDHVPQMAAQYGDVSGISDYHTALNWVRKAEADFAACPAEVRAFFENDPQNMFDFITNPENAKAVEKVGLLAAAQAAKEGAGGGVAPSKSGEAPASPAAPSAAPAGSAGL